MTYLYDGVDVQSMIYYSGMRVSCSQQPWSVMRKDGRQEGEAVTPFQIHCAAIVLPLFFISLGT